MTKNDLKNSKVFIETVDKGLLLHKKLYELGFEVTDVDYNRFPFIYISEHNDFCSAAWEVYQNPYYKAISCDEILNMHIDSSLKPFQRVLGRDREDEFWQCDIYSHLGGVDDYVYHCVGQEWKYCIPYEGNEHLLGTHG